MRLPLLCILPALIGCASEPPPLPAPAGDTVFFPDDIRRDPQRLYRKTVEWAGLIKSIQRTQDSRSDLAILTINHRYLDENARPADAPERLRHFPSTRGEGQIRIPVRLRTAEDRMRIDALQPGDLIFTYGRTSSIAADGTITLTIRDHLDEGVYAAVSPRWFDANALTYGRDSHAPASWSAPPKSQYTPPYHYRSDPLAAGHGTSRDGFYFLIDEQRRQMLISELLRMTPGIHMDDVVAVIGPPDGWDMSFTKVSLTPGPFGHRLYYETAWKTKDDHWGKISLLFGADQRLIEFYGSGYPDRWRLRHDAWVMRMRSE